MNTVPLHWLQAARPKTLPAAIAPVAVGTACASAAGGFRLGPALAALGGALAIQIATNFANDAFDAKRGADGPERIGPVRAVSAGLISARAMLVAMAVAFGVATGFGVYLAIVAGWPVIAIGLVSIVAGMAYTGGPYPLGYHGLGDAAVMIFFGFVAVCGTAYVQAMHVPSLAVWAALPVGALATAILVVNNLRDRRTDERVGKRTLAVRLGRKGSILEYTALLAISYLVPVGMTIATRHWLALLPLATLPLARLRVRALVMAAAMQDGMQYNACLAATAQLLIAHAALFALGLAC